MIGLGVVVLSALAEDDLEEIASYIADASGPSRARNVVEKIRREMERLAYTPRAGVVRQDLDGAPRAYPVLSWMILYDPLADRRGVGVVRVIHGSRDLPRHFRRT